MSMYRIKVTHTLNGEKAYTPQEGYVRKYGHWNPQKEVVWLNLDDEAVEFKTESRAHAFLTLYKSISKETFKECIKEKSNQLKSK